MEETRHIQVGIYPSDGEAILEYEEELDVEFDHILQYQRVTHLDYMDIKPFLDNGYEVILAIEFTDSYANLRDIALGTYDSYLVEFAETIKSYGKMVWLRPLHEFNGDWYSWGVFYDGNAIADFVPAWRHVVQLFRDHSAPVKFQLNYNRVNGKNDPTPFSEFYPGDEWVDLVSITSFNRAYTDEWHQYWHSFAEDFDNAYNQLILITQKPLGVAETSSTSYNGDKPQWIIDAFNSIAHDYTQVEQVSWFLQNKVINGVLCDWDLNSPEEKQAFTQGMNTIKGGVSSTSAYSVVRGMNNVIYHRHYNVTSDFWSNWDSLPSGSTIDRPAAAVCDGELHIVVRGSDGSSLWFSSLNLEDKTFSGWTLLDGATNSAPTLTGSDTRLVLVVRGLNNVVYYRVYDCDADSWGAWIGLPGATCDQPAAVILGDELHLVVRGYGTVIVSQNRTLWHGIINLDDDSFSGWTGIAGETDAAPTLAESTALNRVYLSVKGMDGRIYVNEWAGSWQGWTALASGWTNESPATDITDDVLQVVVKVSNGFSLWHCSVDLNTSAQSSWALTAGASPSPPTLTS